MSQKKHEFDGQYPVHAAVVEKLEEHEHRITCLKHGRPKPRRYIVDDRTVRRLRQKRKLTQSEFADLLGVHSVTISRGETGKLGISRKMKTQIANLRDGAIYLAADREPNQLLC